MLTHRKAPSTISWHQRLLWNKWVHKLSQAKYSMHLLVFVCCVVLVYATPLYWLFFKNFDILLKLSYDNAPQLVSYLQREKSALLLYLIFTGGGVLIATLLLGAHFSAKVVFPLLLLEKRIYLLSKGYFSQDELKVRSTDEHQKLIWNYNYLFRSLRADAKKDLELLRKLEIDNNHRESLFLWQSLIHKKELQLGLSEATQDLRSGQKKPQEKNILDLRKEAS